MNKLTYPYPCQRCGDRRAGYWVIPQAGVFIIQRPRFVCEECWLATDEMVIPDSLRMRELAVAFRYL